MSGAFQGAFSGARVFVTGHTGFKGAWLTRWLLELGADVTGYSLPAEPHQSLFKDLGLAAKVRHVEGNLLDAEKLRRSLLDANPQYVFHLAAQPLVRQSYRNPVETYQVNVIGTANVMEALREVAAPCAAVMITTDKCYENKEWPYGYRENDPLGGYDPYSSSKAAAELVIGSWRQSFFKRHPVRVASARAGNVIGGGDGAPDRLVPDCLAALAAGKAIEVRNPSATRPWQHVLDPLSGYLWLGARLFHAQDPTPLASAFNFGPTNESNRTVRELVETVLKHWPGEWVDRSDPKAPHEAGLLQLCTDKAAGLLQWQQVWEFREAVKRTVEWQREVLGGKPAEECTLAQIRAFQQVAGALGREWAKV